MLNFFKRIAYFIPRLPALNIKKNIGLVIVNSLKQNKLVFDFLLTVTEKN